MAGLANPAAAHKIPDAIWESDALLSRGVFVWALGSLAQLNRIPFDAKLLLQQFHPPYTLASLQEAASAMGLEPEFRGWKECGPDAEMSPCLVIDGYTPDKTGGGTETDGAKAGQTEVRLALVARRNGDDIIWFESGTDMPRTDCIDTLDERFTPVALVLRSRVQRPQEERDEQAKRRFGFRWFIPEVFRYKRIWREVLLASLAIQVMALATPLFTQVVIDKVIVHHTMNTLIVIGFALFMFMMFSAGLTWVRQYLVLHTGNRIDAVLGHRVFSHLFNLPLRYFERRPTGTLIARVQGVETIREFVSGAAVTLLLDLPFLVIFLGVMFYYAWQLTLVVLTLLTIIAVLSLAVTPALRSRLNEQFQLGARNQAFLTEYVSGMETVKSLQMEPQLRSRWDDFLATYLGASFRTRRLANSYNVAANTLEQLQALTVLALGAWLVMTTDSFTIGMLVAFQMFASRLSQPVLRLVGLWQEFQQANIAVRRLGDIMDAPAEPYAVVPARAAGGAGRIEIERLAFRYDEHHPFLYRDLDITVEPGTTVALMGPSGSGKSTLGKLLLGFYPPTDGRLLIDGRDIRHLSANELRGYLGVVPQETMLFSGTIYDNLIVANPHASFEQIVQACRLAEIHDVIEKLPEGYQSQIGEHGAGLSGGQKQRIAIARALLKRPKILVFDEATSHLDPPTAEHLAKTINGLKGKVTILFITHQLPKGLRVDDAIILGRADMNTSEGGRDSVAMPGEDEG